ncbi:uncharacterized protein LOC119600693 [Lucilia sericata]|uniref:uncharacterized protein LOC119600693 n=1 Tax=Lucilia sericata TaxID=13632 RepID=UPI0018A85E88|nr:uncharacterized protein LOC119600693 [Lucilia sericata]
MEDTSKLRSCIELYKTMPELWNCKNENYKNKNIRNKRYNKLLIEYKKVKKDATLDELKKKIANMRTCYRRELRKVLRSKKSGADDIYVSNLWYYDYFDFLRDVEMPGRTNLSSDEEESGIIKVEKKQVSKKSLAADTRIELLKKAVDHLESSSKIARVEDEADTYANGWAYMYKQMNTNQQLFAKRAIEEILILGRFNKLNFDTVQCITNQSANFHTSISRDTTPCSTPSIPVNFNEDSIHFPKNES